jgi:glycosyltransferase involved in cell wall biosynthesis
MPWDVRNWWQHHRRAAKRYGRRYWAACWYALRQGRPSLWWRFVQSANLANQAQRLRVRQFHGHFANRPTNVVFFASWMTGIPYSFTAHAVDLFRDTVNPRALTKKIECARFVVAISEYNRQFLARLANGAADRIVRVYNGIDLTRFQPTGHAPSAPRTMLCVSRLVEKKGLLVLLEACRLLRDRGVAFHCWIVGEGALRQRLSELVRTWALQEHVRLLGPLRQGEVLRCYGQAEIFVLPCQTGADGNRDGLPVSIVEALACGLPVVTTPMTGIPEVVRDGENGLLVPEGDAEALAQAIQRTLGDQQLLARLRSRARPSVVSTFDCHQTAARLQQLFAQGVGS